MSALVPAKVRTAAKRGFIRTTTQALATVIPLGTITGAALSSADPATIAWSVAAGALSSVGAGAASYLSILSKGIPEDYQGEPEVDQAGRHALTPDEAALVADIRDVEARGPLG